MTPGPLLLVTCISRKWGFHVDFSWFPQVQRVGWSPPFSSLEMPHGKKKWIKLSCFRFRSLNIKVIRLFFGLVRISFPCLDTLDLRQSTFAQWRFEQCHISYFVDTKLLDTIHLEHDNMVQRSIGATILRSENYMARRSTSTNTLNCSFTLLAASACKDLRLSGTRHIFSYLMRCDKLWWVLRRCVYVWLPLTTHIYIRMCRFSGTSPICRRSRMLLYTQKSEQGSSGGSNFLHLSCCLINLL